MPLRKPVAAGRFYSANKKELEKDIHFHLDNAVKQNNTLHKKSWGWMLPHAGYVYCGNIIGQTLKESSLSQKIIILCPNHTGYGTMFSVWPSGEWATPLGAVKVDAMLAEEIAESNGGFCMDTMAHLQEHSIEVLLPFIQILSPASSIVPICVGTRDAAALERAAYALANVLKKPENQNVNLVISSDMNHYENEKQTLAKDELALREALKGDPESLLQIVQKHNISMCGASPLALALFTAKFLGGAETEFIAHTTSAKTTGDYEHVVGYAGLKLYLKSNNS